MGFCVGSSACGSGRVVGLVQCLLGCITSQVVCTGRSCATFGLWEMRRISTRWLWWLEHISSRMLQSLLGSVLRAEFRIVALTILWFVSLEWIYYACEFFWLIPRWEMPNAAWVARRGVLWLMFQCIKCQQWLAVLHWYHLRCESAIWVTIKQRTEASSASTSGSRR